MKKKNPATERLRALNADHHRRMSADATSRRDTARDYEIRRLDMTSRANITQAMAGARDRYKLQGPRALLELGAGYGGDISYLMDYFGLKHYQGVEVVPEVQKAAGSAHIALGSFEDMADEPLDTQHRPLVEEYGFIYSRHVMEHVLDVNRAIKALKTLLAPGGVIGAVTPHYFPDPEPAHVCQLKIEEWLEAYEKHGLKVVYAVETHFACAEAHIIAIHENDFNPDL